MEKQVCSIEQMKELKKLGIDTSKAVFAWNKYPYTDEYIIGPIINNNSIPTFTLQDILEITAGTVPSLWRKDGIPTWHINNHSMKCHFIGPNLMNIAFEYIKWCKQNNYI